MNRGRAAARQISFLVPAWNAERHIPEFVASFRKLSVADAELVLCAGGSDASYPVARAYAGPRIQIVQQLEGDGKQGALKKCLEQSSGEIVYLTDIDCRPSDAVVANLLRVLETARARVVTGASMPLEAQLDSAMVRVHWAIERAGLPHAEVEIGGILGRNAAIERSLVEELSAFEVPAPSGTDYTLAKEVLRRGHKIIFVPDYPMPSEYPDRFWVYVHKQARWLRNVAVLGLKYRAFNDVRDVMPTLAMPYLLLAGLMASVWLKSYVALLLCLLIVARALANRQGYQRRAGLRPSLLGSVSILLADQLAALKAGWQMLRGTTPW